jgi:outer membrane cobalamin receptor
MLPVTLEEVDRIEVTRGPNAASYGANSFTGIINIITRHPAQDKGTLFSATTGDPDLRDGFLRHAGRWAGWDFRLSAGHREDSGFAARNDSQHTDSLLVRGDRLLNATDSLQVQAGWAWVGLATPWTWRGTAMQRQALRSFAGSGTQARTMSLPCSSITASTATGKLS